MSAILCPSCGAVVPAEHVNIVRLVAKCVRCQSVFSFEPPLGVERRGALAPPIVDVPLPRGIVLEHGALPQRAEGYRVAPGSAGRLAISYRPSRASALALLFAAAVWDAFLVFWYAAAFSGNARWIVFVFPLIHVGVGVYITYGALTALVNRTQIIVENGVLRVVIGPLPTRGNRTVPVEQVQQLYTTRKDNKNGHEYAIHAVVSTGPVITLVTGLDDAQQALFIEQTVERHLGIPDQSVPGEVAR